MRDGYRSPHTVDELASNGFTTGQPLPIVRDHESPVAPPGRQPLACRLPHRPVHLSIGQAYAWSVFKPPLESALGLSGTQSALPFQLGIVMLGLSAAFGGTLVERNGPRWR